MQNYLEQLIARAQGFSPLRQLRVLTVSKRAINRCVTALKKFDVDVIQKMDTSSLADLPTTTMTVPSGTVSSTLDRCVDDLFSSHTDKGRYLEFETKVLTGIYTEILSRFKEYQSQRRAVLKSQSMLYRTLHQLSDAAGQAGESPKITVPEEEGQLQVDVVIKMLLVHAEAIGRCYELSSTTEVVRNMRALMKILLDHVYMQYVDIAVETALEDLKMSDGKTGDPDLAQLYLLTKCDHIARLLQMHFETAVLPLLVNHPAMMRDMLNEKNALLTQMEAKLNTLMHRQLDVIMNWLGVILGKQKKTAYNCDDSEIDIMNLNTAVCIQACDFIRKVEKTVTAQLSHGRNRDIFLTEVGVSFHAMILDYIKKQTVNATGGLVLSKDITMFQSSVDAFHIRTLNERFDMLREVSNLYLVKPEILPSILSEGHLGKLEYKMVVPLLASRHDWSKIERQVKSDMNNVISST